MISNLFNIKIEKDTRNKKFDEKENNLRSRCLNRGKESDHGERISGDKPI